MTSFGQYPPAQHLIAHFSDTHFLADRALLHGAVDTDSGLVQALEHLEASGLSPDALVFTGDLTDLGEPEAYERLRDAVEPVAARIGAELVWVMGNHDERAPYARLLFGEAGGDGPQDRVYEFGGLRLISLDTSVPGYHHGELRDSQLDWLAGELARPAPHGTLLALHHPPIPTPLEVMQLLELREQHRLAAVIEGTDVRGILGGHLHYASHGSFAGIPVSVAAATCYTLRAMPPRERLISGVDGGKSINLVHVYDDRIVNSVVPLGDFPEVSAWPPAVREALAALSPEERLEAMSSKNSTFPLAEFLRGD